MSQNRIEGFITQSQPAAEDRAGAAGAELIGLAERIRELQVSAGMSTRALLRAYPGLGSDKTFGKLAAGNLEQVDIPKQLANYRSALQEFVARAGGPAEVYADLGQCPAILRSLDRFAVSGGQRAVFILQGPSGSGKSTILDLLERRRPGKCLRVTGQQSWRCSPVAMLRDMTRRLPPVERKSRRKGDSRLVYEQMEEAKERMLTASRLILIDEGQYLTGAGLNFIKDCLNEAAARGIRLLVLIAAQSTLWSRLEEEAAEEARQLRHNRLFRRVVLAPPTAEQCRSYVARLIDIGDDCRDEWQRVATNAARLGHWAYVRNVRDELIDGEGAEITPKRLREVARSVAEMMAGEGDAGRTP